MEDQVELPEEAKRAAAEALDHAGDLLEAADLLREPFPHLAYHFGVLALEEVGRSSLIVMNELARRREYATRRFEREAQDHVRKLFWALWGPTMGREVITGEQIEEFQGLAQRLHEARQSGLYYSGPDAPPPREAIDAEETGNLLRLARARLGMARTHAWVSPDSEQAADIRWFMDATADPDTRTQIMSGASMKRLAELGTVPKWVHWLRTEFEGAEQEALARAQEEISREQPGTSEELEPKYQMKLRFESASHSIRPQPLQRWNEGIDWIKLHPVPTNRRELIAEITIPKRVSIHTLWWAGYRVANQLLVALNIGSLGFFWWRMPESVSRFYEELIDLEAGERFAVERTPALRIDWGHGALTDQTLNQISLCFAALSTFADEGEQHPFDHYLTGLAFLAKTDVTIQFEANAFEHFYLALKEAGRLFGQWDGTGSFADHFEQLAQPYFESDEERASYVEAARLIDASRSPELRVDLSQVAAMKVLADSVFIKKFRELFDEHVAEQRVHAGQPSDKPDGTDKPNASSQSGAGSRSASG
jgi:AbiV family abortive infection protein